MVEFKCLEGYSNDRAQYSLYSNITSAAADAEWYRYFILR
jgi:hypothetical protein